MTSESNLRPDGTVFPPVTPDPPMPPGQEEIVVPDVVPAHRSAESEPAAEEELSARTDTPAPKEPPD